MVISTAILIVLYIIGFIMCIVANLINEKNEKKEEDLEFWLAILWMGSCITVPLATIVGIVCIIVCQFEKAMKNLTKIIYRKIYKKEEQPK